MAADGRFLSRSLAHSAQVARLPLDAAYLFVACIPHLDVEGRMLGGADVVRATAVPLRPEYSIERVGECLKLIQKQRLTVAYRVGGRDYLWFPGFRNHQRNLRADREAPSRHPPPPKGRTNSGGAPDQLRSSSGVTQAKVSEGKSSNKKGSEARAREAAGHSVPARGQRGGDPTHVQAILPLLTLEQKKANYIAAAERSRENRESAG